MNPIEFPPFVAARGIKGGHAQTIVGAYLPFKPAVTNTQRHAVSVSDGDQVILHDDLPTDPSPDNSVCLMLHGLSGSAQSSYMVRIAQRLREIGIRTFRMEHRGAGHGEGLAKRPYNAGISEDVFASIEKIRKTCGNVPITVLGFSMSGNVALKAGIEISNGSKSDSVGDSLIRIISVSPPVDLKACSRSLHTGSNRIYDINFVRSLNRQIAARWDQLDMPGKLPARMPKTLYEFDDVFTAPMNGYSGAEEYYATCSTVARLQHINLPTLILTAANDPLIPKQIFADVQPSPSTQLHIAAGGGHMGFLSRKSADPDRRWLDWRILEWIQQQDGSRQRKPRPHIRTSRAISESLG